MSQKALKARAAEVAVAASMASRVFDGHRDDWHGINQRCSPAIWQVCNLHRLSRAETSELAQAVYLQLVNDLNNGALARMVAENRVYDLSRRVTDASENRISRMQNATWERRVKLVLTLIMDDLPGGRRSARRHAVAGFSVRSLTALAAWLAGHEGPSLRDESKSHLAGENGHDRVSWAKVSEAAGFVIAGLRYRSQGWADAAWKPAGVVLRSRFLSGLFVAVPTITVAFEVLTHKGTMTLLTSLGAIFGTWTFLAGTIKAGREYRDVRPPPPKARQAGEDDRGV